MWKIMQIFSTLSVTSPTEVCEVVTWGGERTRVLSISFIFSFSPA
jgi:hypothetical protein